MYLEQKHFRTEMENEDQFVITPPLQRNWRPQTRQINIVNKIKFWLNIILVKMCGIFSGLHDTSSEIISPGYVKGNHVAIKDDRFTKGDKC